MGKQAGLDKAVEYFIAEEHRILGQIGQLADEQRQLQLQLEHIRQVRASLGGGDATLTQTLATETAKAPATPRRRGRPPGSRNASKSSTGRKTSTRTRTTRKGRRKTTKAAGGVNSMSIVDAAIHFARENNQAVVDAGQILEWFNQAGYETRNGTPNRNSIYVSLNRERHDGEKSGNVRVEHVERGKFRFPEVAGG